MRHTLLAVAAVVCFAGCATPYQERGMMGGFSESQLGPRVWRINFISNPGRTPDEVKDMILLRAAELVAASGQERFVVVSASDQSLITGVVGVSAISGGVFASLFTPMRNPDISAVIEARPRGSLREIEYDAAFLLRNIGPKYGLRAAVAPEDRGRVLPATPTPAPTPAVATPPVALGQDSVSAERFSRQVGCTQDKAATLIGKGPGYESFSFQCMSGETLVVRCDFGNCRALK